MCFSSNQEHKEFYESVFSLALTPRSLQHLARCRLRSFLEGRVHKVVPKLDLPTFIKNYLLLECRGYIHWKHFVWSLVRVSPDEDWVLMSAATCEEGAAVRNIITDKIIIKIVTWTVASCTSTLHIFKYILKAFQVEEAAACSLSLLFQINVPAVTCLILRHKRELETRVDKVYGRYAVVCFIFYLFYDHLFFFFFYFCTW